MKSSPQYRFFRVIMGGELIDIDIFQYPDKTTVVISIIDYRNEQMIMVSKTDIVRKTAIKLALQSFKLSKQRYENKHNPPPILEVPY
ncbi:hypothetical protein [Fictibacillus barbaricus]|uniref:Zn-dependent metalloprotease n=1 Tax=Fictibacillus barbaricus TaxID=182136 RepID=A0ABU1TW23_9BACL|nr:hypothetical protein [Fictibacillus barbaricus]MDR7071414.1 Zn-dependent metalloprotease [Fictibacillus barbaricus]